jgi:Ca-activated chloride channel family protein
MFTQDIANLMPGLPIKVTLTYAQTVPRVDGAYELVIPLVVGPRYQPQGAGVAPGQPAPKGGVPALECANGDFRRRDGGQQPNRLRSVGSRAITGLPAGVRTERPGTDRPGTGGLDHPSSTPAWRSTNIESRTHPITTETPEQEKPKCG